MVWEQDVAVEGICCRVVISDEADTLLAAKVAGRVIVGCLGGDSEKRLPMARYLVETADAADAQYLERVVRREKGMPWIIGESKRLRLREFIPEDAFKIPAEPEDKRDDRIFYHPDKLRAYIRSQYGFWEYGLWAVERRKDGQILGKAGLTNWDENGYLELAYHIFAPYRRQGYAEEACRLVLDYAHKEYKDDMAGIYAITEASNHASARLLQKLGFEFTASECSGARHRYILGESYC